MNQDVFESLKLQTFILRKKLEDMTREFEYMNAVIESYRIINKQKESEK